MELSDTSVDDYLDTIDDPQIAETMTRLDLILSQAMPDRRRALYEGTFWGGTEQTIIGYGHIVQSRPRGEDVHWFLVGLARQKSHYSLYVNAVADGKYLGQHYEGRLGKVKLGSASIGFKHLEDLDLDVLGELLVRADEVTDPDPSRHAG
jgi:hypothetical protein